MAETATPPAASPATPPAPDPNAPPPVKYVGGKYDTPEAFLKATNELHGELGMKPIDTPLFGDGGKFSGPADAETYYKGLKAIYDGNPAARKSKQPPAAPPAATPSEPSKDAAKATDGLDIKPDPAGPPAKGLAKILAKAGLAGQEKALAEQFVKEGRLTDEQYAALDSKADVDREAVDAFMSAQIHAETTRRDAAMAEAVKIAGGEEQHQALREYGKTLKDDKTFQALNRAVADDHSQYPALIGYVESKYRAQHGSAAPHARGNAPGSTLARPQSKAEYDALHNAVKNGDPVAIERFRALAKAYGPGIIPNAHHYIGGRQ